MTTPLAPGVERVLFTEEQIAARIREVAASISHDYHGRTLKLIGVLKGSVFFLTELARHLAARIQEEMFYELEAPVLRACGFDTPYPPARLERLWLPGPDRLLDCVERALALP